LAGKETLLRARTASRDAGGLRRQRSWLMVEPLPAYAPELNAFEPLWSSFTIIY
jgi:hypothetical protein